MSMKLLGETISPYMDLLGKLPDQFRVINEYVATHEQKKKKPTPRDRDRLQEEWSSFNASLLKAIDTTRRIKETVQNELGLSTESRLLAMLNLSAEEYVREREMEDLKAANALELSNIRSIFVINSGGIATIFAAILNFHDKIEGMAWHSAALLSFAAGIFLSVLGAIFAQERKTNYFAFWRFSAAEYRYRAWKYEMWLRWVLYGAVACFFGGLLAATVVTLAVAPGPVAAMPSEMTSF